MTNCKTCNLELTSKYCPNCGQPSQLKRIDGHYIIHEIEHVLHFERGILYTIKELIANPGQNVRNYLSDNRSRLVKPIIFIIVTSLIYSTFSNFFHIEDGYVNYLDDHKSTTSAIFKWIQGHYGYANIIMGIFIALWTKLFFRKYKLNMFTDVNEFGVVSSEFGVFPNPATNILEIESDESCKEILIYGSTGNLIISANKKNHIDISFLEPGLYFLLLKSKSGIQSQKFIKN